MERNPKWAHRRRTDALVRHIAWMLPHRLVMWCGMRIGAHATSGAFGHTVVPELEFMEAMKRWESDTGGDKKYGQR